MNKKFIDISGQIYNVSSINAITQIESFGAEEDKYRFIIYWGSNSYTTISDEDIGDLEITRTKLLEDLGI